MVTIDLHDHPFNPGKPKRYEAASVGEWLLEHYSGDRVAFSVYEGQPSVETDVTGSIEALTRSEGHFVVLQSPGGSKILGSLFPIFLLQFKLFDLLKPKIPALPANLSRPQQSQNNALGNRSNQARLLERIEDIYGTERSFPSLLQPVYSKYINHIQHEYSYMCIGRGWYDVDDVRDGESLLADIDGSSAAFFNPFASPNSGSPFLTIGDAIADPVLLVKRSNNVSGQTLMARNQFVLSQGGSIQFKTAADAGIDGDVLIPASPDDAFFDSHALGNTLHVTMSDFAFATTASLSAVAVASTKTFTQTNLGATIAPNPGEIIRVGAFSDPANIGDFTAVSYTTHSITVAESLVDESHGDVIFQGIVNYTGDYVSESIPAAYQIELTTASFSRTVTAPATITNTNGSPEWTNWITLKDPDMTQVWCNIVAPNGIFADAGSGKGGTGTSYEIQTQELDGSYAPVGSIASTTGSMTGATSDERAITVEVTNAWVGPTRVRMRRTNDFPYGFAGTVVDEIKWQDLFAVTPIADPDFGNITTVQLLTRATTRALAAKDRKANCRVTRRLPTFDGTDFSGAFAPDGSIASGTISGTNRFVDILAAVSVDPLIGGRNLATDVDMDQIWSVFQAVDAWNPLCAEFSYTLDSDNFSFEETVSLIANACFCQAYRQNGKIRFFFDTAQESSTALFTHRNKKPSSDSISRKFSSDSDYDGIELVYKDSETDQNETIKLPLDGTASKYKKLETSGVRNYVQAWYKASRELARLSLQRIALETDVTADGRLLLPGSRIDVVDNTRFDANDGEVISQAGLELTLSRDVTFGTGSHSIVFIKRDGSLQSIACTAGSAANKVVLAGVPAEAIVTTQGANGVRTIFSFGPDSGRGAMAYLVQELDMDDSSYVKLKAINYDSGYYASDTEDVPDKDTVIQ